MYSPANYCGIVTRAVSCAKRKRMILGGDPQRIRCLDRNAALRRTKSITDGNGEGTA